MPPKVVKAKSWSKLDTDRLIKLAEVEAVIDVNDPLAFTKDYIENIRYNYFRHFEYKNFQRNYVDKLRQNCFVQEHLDGARRKGKKTIVTYYHTTIIADIHFFVAWGVRSTRKTITVYPTKEKRKT
jgi:hypothetical protein